MDLYTEESYIKVLIAVPAYGGQVSTDWMMAFVNTQQMGIEKNIIFGIHVRSNSSLIPKCRDEIVHKFLFETDYDYLLCIDADVVWIPEQILGMVDKAKTYGTIFGPYPAKQDENKFFIEPMRIDGDLVDQDGLIRLKSGPAGFMMVSRETLLNLRDQNKFLEYKSSEYEERVCALFMPMIFMDQYRGEDISFCIRLLHANERMWVDPSIELTHIGIKKYKQSFTEFLNANTDTQPKQVSAR